MEEFLRLIGTHKVQVKPIVTHVFSIDRAPEAYDTIMGAGSNSLAVLLKYSAADSTDPVAEYKPVRRVDILPGPKPKDQLGVALVGAGNLARWQHLPVLQKMPGVNLRAIHSTNGMRGKSYALRFGAAYCATDYDQVLQDPDIDVVVIVSRNQHHARQSLAALRAGKHVFVEKPMALTEGECRDLYLAVQETGKHITVGFNRRFAPFYKPLKEHLARRSSPAVLHCRINSPGISGAYWMADPAIGGAILGEACHFIDLMYWLLDAEPVQVSAYSLPLDSKDPVGMNNMAASFHFSDGSVGALTYCTVGSRTSGGERVEAYAPGIGLITENFKQLTINGSVQQIRKKMFAQKGYGDQMEDFLTRLRKGQSPSVTVLDGIRSTVGCIRMLESARTLTPQSIDMVNLLEAGQRVTA
jgi:predicted dehydrogenase